MVLNPAAHQIP